MIKEYSSEYIIDQWLNQGFIRGRKYHLYIDSPMCIQACKYCIYTPIVTTIGSDMYYDYYRKTLPNEIEKFKKVLEKYPFESVYFGGGTSSLMTIEVMKEIFDSIPKFKEIPFKLFEAHPSFLTEKKIDLLKEYNFTNVSLGVQSFNKELIESQNRIYNSPEKIKEKVDYIKSKGMYVNCDLLAFMESPTTTDLDKYIAKDIEIMVDINPSYLDLYPNHKEVMDYDPDIIYHYRKIISKFLIKHPNWRFTEILKFDKEDIKDLSIRNYKLTTLTNEELMRSTQYCSSGGKIRLDEQNVLALGCSEIKSTYSYFGQDFYYLNQIVDGEIVYTEEY